MFRTKCAGQNNSNTNHFKTFIILVLFRPSHNRLGYSFPRGPPTADWSLRTGLWQWLGRHPTGWLWSSPGSMRGQSALTLGREKSLLRWYLGKRAFCESSFCLRRHLKSLNEVAEYMFCCPFTKTGLGRQYVNFCCENQLGYSQSLFLWKLHWHFWLSIQWRWRQPGHQWSFSSFWLFFLSSTAVKIEFIWIYDIFFFPHALSTDNCIPTNFCCPG